MYNGFQAYTSEKAPRLLNTVPNAKECFKEPSSVLLKGLLCPIFNIYVNNSGKRKRRISYC